MSQVNQDMTVGQRERATQDRVVALFQHALGYEYLGNWIDRPDNSNVEKFILRPYLLSKGYSETLVDKAIFEFERAT